MKTGRIVFILTVALSLSADTLRLRSGGVVNGSFLGGSPNEVRFMVGDEVQRFPVADVVAIDFTGAAPPSSPHASAPPPPVDLGPDIVGAPFLRGANGYIPLEREYGMMSRGGGGIYGMGGGTVYRIQGSRSPVRVRQNDRIVFVIRLNGGADPRQFQLFRLQPYAGYRQTQPTMGGLPPSLPVTIQKTGDGVYEIYPAQRLYPGEYAVSPMNANESYCFGVDY